MQSSRNSHRDRPLKSVNECLKAIVAQAMARRKRNGETVERPKSYGGSVPDTIRAKKRRPLAAPPNVGPLGGNNLESEAPREKGEYVEVDVVQGARYWPGLKIVAVEDAAVDVHALKGPKPHLNTVWYLKGGSEFMASVRRVEKRPVRRANVVGHDRTLKRKGGK